MPRTDPGHRPAKGTLKPGASHVLGRGLGGTCEVQAKYMRGTSQAQAKGYGIAPLGIRRVSLGFPAPANRSVTECGRSTAPDSQPGGFRMPTDLVPGAYFSAQLVPFCQS